MSSNVISSRQNVRAERCIQFSVHLILTISLFGLRSHLRLCLPT
jgi:hypothetical protein